MASGLVNSIMSWGSNVDLNVLFSLCLWRQFCPVVETVLDNKHKSN